MKLELAPVEVFQEKTVPEGARLAGLRSCVAWPFPRQSAGRVVCVRRTVEVDLPHEIDYLRRHDEAIGRIMDAVEMPDRVAENLILYIRRNDGALPRKRRDGEFNKLTDDEVGLIENIVSDVFAGF